MDAATERLWAATRELWPIVKYRPNRKQEIFHRSRAGIRVLSGGNQCVALDTEIATLAGPRSAGSVKVGDSVVGGTVTDVWISPEPVPTWRVWGKLTANAEHPLWTPTGWRTVRELDDKVPDRDQIVIGHTIHPTNTYYTNGLLSHNSGKTHGGLCEDLAFMFGFRPWMDPDDPDFYVYRSDGSRLPVPNRGRLACPDFPNALTNAIYPKFLELAPRGLIQMSKNAQGYPTKWTAPWNSNIAVMSYEQEWIKYESFTGDWMHFDEPPPRSMWISSLRGMMKTGGPITLTITPHSEEWLIEELYEKEDSGRTIEIIRMSTEDNLIENGGVLSREGYERFMSALTPMEKRIRLHGEGALAGGRCLPDFGPHAIVEPFVIPKDWLRIMVIDPHEEKPDACLWMAIDPDRWDEDLSCSGVIYDEVMDRSSQGNIGKTASTIRVHEKNSGGMVRRRLIDPRAAEWNFRQTQRTYREEFALFGIRTETAPGLKISKGLKMVNAWFAKTGDDLPKLQVFSNCLQTIDQCKHLIFIRDRKNYQMKIRTKGPDDFVAGLRYLATWGPNTGNLGGRDFEDYDDVEEDLLTDLQGETTTGAWTGY